MKNALRQLELRPVVRERAPEILREHQDRRSKDENAQREILLRERQHHEGRRLELARRRFDSEIPADLFAQLEEEERRAITIIDKALRGIAESPPIDISREIAWLEKWSTTEEFDLEAWPEFARLFIREVIVQRKPAVRSNRWHFNLDTQTSQSSVYQPRLDCIHHLVHARELGTSSLP